MKMKRTILLLFASISLAACGTAASNTTEQETVTVTDGRGDVELPFQPEKVVVFDNGALDTLRALEVEEAIIGTVTQNPPAYLADFSNQFENVGTLKEPNLETLAELKPDLIIVSNRMSDFIEQLEEIAPVLWLTTSVDDYWTSVSDNIRTLGTIFGTEDAAEELVAETETHIEEIQTVTENLDQKALVLLLNDGAISAYSTGSRFGYIFDTFGFQPVDEAIESSTHGQSIGYEGILEINPDIIFVVDRSKAIQAEGVDQMPLLDNEFIQKTNAFQNDQVISLLPDLWYLSGGGVESLKLMMDEISAPFE